MQLLTLCPASGNFQQMQLAPDGWLNQPVFIENLDGARKEGGLLRYFYHGNMHGVAICITIHSHSLNSQPSSRSDDPAGNFTTIGYQDFG